MLKTYSSIYIFFYNINKSERTWKKCWKKSSKSFHFLSQSNWDCSY